jgi:protein SCO1
MPTRRAQKRQHRHHAAAPAVFSATAGVLVLAGLYLWLLRNSAPHTDIGGPFVLTQDKGEVVTDRDFRGRFLLIYFGYTSCPDLCPTTLNAVADAVGILGRQADRVQALFITVDPKRDTPAVMRAFASSFSRQIIGLSGTAAQIQAVEREYHVVYRVRSADSGASGYEIDHSAVIFLIAPDGRYLDAIAATATGAQIADTITRFLS